MNRLSVLILGIICTYNFAWAQGQYKVLYSFGGQAGGLNVSGPLATDRSGHLFGTAQVGGIVPNCDGGGCGVVWALSQIGGTWQETVLHDFCSNSGCADGIFPETGVIADSAGNLYGEAPYGGLQTKLCYSFLSFEAGCGVVFELSPPTAPGMSWTFTLLHTFCSDMVNNVCQDGAVPLGGLTMDTSGNLYGTTVAGGRNDSGTVFELSPAGGTWNEAVLYNFCADGFPNCPDGARPESGVTFDSLGNLYGSTDSDSTEPYPATVFKLSPSGGNWIHAVIYSFPQPQQQQPRTFSSIGPVTADPGSIYTSYILRDNPGGIARMNSRGIVHNFNFDGQDGSYPIGKLLFDRKRDVLYGVTSGLPGFGNDGNIYQFDKSGQETVLYDFCPPNCANGYLGAGGLLEDPAGNLYGIAELGGEFGGGVVYEFTPQ